jgi:hypothetical protein
MIGPIEDAALVRRENSGTLTWCGPLLMFIARPAGRPRAVAAALATCDSWPAPSRKRPTLTLNGTRRRGDQF